MLDVNSSLTNGVIADIERGKSMLLAFGRPGRELKRKIAPTGFVCRFLFFLIFNPIFILRAKFFPNAWKRRRNTALKIMRLFFPFTIRGYKMPPTSHGQIFVINHPTLNDPICAIVYALLQNPAREVIVPVNLPWYESICRYRAKLLKIGINIVPILTPQTAKRLDEDANVSKTQTMLMKNYVAEFMKTLSAGGMAVVAQQATRKRYIFTDAVQAETGSEILSTISLILDGTRRAKLLDEIFFIPVGVVPHKINAKAKLNPFRKYMLNIGEPILGAELAAVKNAAKRPADLYMLLKLKDLLPREYHFENDNANDLN
jgi:hypothetical protein